MSLLLRIANVQYVAYIHTAGYEALASKSPVYRLAVRALLGGAVRSVVLGPRLIGDVRSLVSSPPVVIYNPSERPRGVVRSGALAGPVTFAYFSNLISEKGIFDFIEFCSALESEQDTKFIIAGAESADVSFADLKRRLADRNLSHRISLWGAVELAERERLLASIDVLVFPSSYRFEAQPLSIIEAMARGAAILAYDTGGVGDLVSQQNGALVPNRDLNALVTLGHRLVSDRAWLSNLQNGSLRLFDEKHSLDTFGSAWVGLIESLRRA